MLTRNEKDILNSNNQQNFKQQKTNQMKKTQLLFMAVIITATLFTQQASAKIWRVNNQSNYNATKNLWGDNFGGTQSYPCVCINFSQVVSLGV